MRPGCPRASDAEGKRQVQQAGKKANGVLPFIARGFGYRSRDCLAANIHGLGEATPAILVSLSEEGCSCSRGSTEKVYRTDSWDGGTDV